MESRECCGRRWGRTVREERLGMERIRTSKSSESRGTTRGSVPVRWNMNDALEPVQWKRSGKTQSVESLSLGDNQFVNRVMSPVSFTNSLVTTTITIIGYTITGSIENHVNL